MNEFLRDMLFHGKVGDALVREGQNASRMNMDEIRDRMQRILESSGDNANDLGGQYLQAVSLSYWRDNQAIEPIMYLWSEYYGSRA